VNTLADYRLHFPLNTVIWSLSMYVYFQMKTPFLWYFAVSTGCNPYNSYTCYTPSSSDPLNTFRGSATSTTIVMIIATIMYNAKSHIKQVNQYASGEVPAISCSCLAFDTLSINGNIWKLPVKKSKPNGIRVIHDNMTPTVSPNICWN